MQSPARGRVLVVDDEVFIVQLLERMLGREHDVMSTTSPLEALEWIRQGRRFDVIPADVMMPGVTGIGGSLPRCCATKSGPRNGSRAVSASKIVTPSE
jgi:DNA-binding NtrC family response regulator